MPEELIIDDITYYQSDERMNHDEAADFERI
jgi:hypothetical protein